MPIFSRVLSSGQLGQRRVSWDKPLNLKILWYKDSKPPYFHILLCLYSLFILSSSSEYSESQLRQINPPAYILAHFKCTGTLHEIHRMVLCFVNLSGNVFEQIWHSFSSSSSDVLDSLFLRLAGGVDLVALAVDFDFAPFDRLLSNFSLSQLTRLACPNQAKKTPFFPRRKNFPWCNFGRIVMIY